MAADPLARIADLLEAVLDERTVLAVSPIEAGRRLCADNPLSPDVVKRLVDEGLLARVPHTTRVLIPVADLQRFAASGVRGRSAA